jgi:Molybdate transporter of MFS superfamily
MRLAAASHREPPSILRELGGACGDLGTFIPHVIGAMTVAGLAPVGVLFGFGLFLISTGLFYGLPMPVQPMKAVSAVILTNGLRPGEVAAAGLILGMVLLVLGITGWIGRFARMIPQSVSAGLQLGLGLLMGVLGISLMLETPWIGFGSLAMLLTLARIPRCPAAPIVLGMAAMAGWTTNGLAVHDIGFAPKLAHEQVRIGLTAGGRWIRTFGSRTRHQAVRPRRGRFPVIGSSAAPWPKALPIRASLRRFVAVDLVANPRRRCPRPPS